MADKLLIGISIQGATVADWRSDRMRDCVVYPNDDAGLADYKEHVAGAGHVPVYFLVDAVEEDYRFDMLPHAIGRDRTELVARKLRHHYRNSPYTAAWLLGRDKGKRRDDRYLFSALTNADLITEWLQPVVAHKLPVAGVFLLPMASAGLLQTIDPKAPNLLLVAQHATGLRLTFFRDRQFRLSRLTRSDSARAENRRRFFLEEISNTRLYLHALRALALDEPLTVILLDRGDELSEIAAELVRENPTIECLRLGRTALTDRLGISESLLDASPYAVYLQLMGRGAPPVNLAPAGMMREFRRYQARRAIYASCGAVAASAVVWAGLNLHGAITTQWGVEDAARQTAMLAARYQDVTRQFPQAPASAENLRKTVEIAQKLRTASHNPQRLMALVSRSLDSYPSVVIRQLGWKYGSAVIETEAGARGRSADQIAADRDGGRRESALIDGEIRPFRGDYRSAIAMINSFAEQLAAERDVAEVRVVKLPLNVNPALALSGSTLDTPEETAGASAAFRLILVLRHGA